MKKAKVPTVSTAAMLPLWRGRVVFFVAAAVIGGAAVLFWAASHYVHDILYQFVHRYPFLPLAATPIGFALISFITNKYFVAAQGSGVPQTIAALSSHDPNVPKKLLSLPIAAAKIVLTSAGQMCGGSIGREGPMVQVGASIMYSLSRFIPMDRMSPHHLDRSLIAAGGAAGVASAFNTPVAGVVFAIEQLVKVVEVRTCGVIVAAVAIATIVARLFFADYGYFNHIAIGLPSYSVWGAILACGVGGGVLGGIFSYGLLPASKILPLFVRNFRQSSPIGFAAACGFCVALLGLLSDSTIYGNGSHETRLLLQDAHSLPMTFSALKLLATFFSCVSGIPAGLFAPSLAVGAGFGADVSMMVSSAPAATFVLLGIGAYFAGVFQAPLTAVVIVTEMAGSYSLALPLMVVALIATATSRLICRRSFYSTMSEKWLERLTPKQTLGTGAIIEQKSN